PTMAATMLAGMLTMTVACWLYAIGVALVRLRCILRERGEIDAGTLETTP
ncbi:MAG TPA: heme ABC transporter permease, partial [Cupriavidus sp.]|nr:heme ABC transporter permease [Cupriavidus sp.]